MLPQGAMVMWCCAFHQLNSSKALVRRGGGLMPHPDRDFLASVPPFPRSLPQSRKARRSRSSHFGLKPTPGPGLCNANGWDPSRTSTGTCSLGGAWERFPPGGKVSPAAEESQQATGTVFPRAVAPAAWPVQRGSAMRGIHYHRGVLGRELLLFARRKSRRGSSSAPGGETLVGGVAVDWPTSVTDRGCHADRTTSGS